MPFSCEWDGTDFRIVNDGTVVIDSGRQNYIIANYKTGSFTIQPTSTIDAYDPALEFDLGAVSPLARLVSGQFIAVQSSPYTDVGLVNGYWHQIGGTTPIYAGRHRMWPGGSTDPRYRMHLTGTLDSASYMDITWLIESSRLKAIVSRYYPFDPDNGTRPPFLRFPITVTYHAFCETFDN